MEEQFISIETAKICKQIGCELKGAGYYVLNFMNFKEDEVMKFSEGLFLSKNSKGQPHLARAFPQWLLQKWLRDVHGIHVRITTYAFGYHVFLDNTPDPKFSGKDYRRDTTRDFLTYEEALEFGLNCALTLLVAHSMVEKEWMQAKSE